MDSTRGARDSTSMHHAVTTHTVKLFHSEYSTNIHSWFIGFSSTVAFFFNTCVCGHSRGANASVGNFWHTIIDRSIAPR